MPTYTVKQSGGDFSSLNAALSDVGTVNGDTISIQGPWTSDDVTAATVIDTGITITADSESRHNGYYDTSENHYRLVVGSRSNAAALQFDSSSGGIVDGIAVKSTSTDTSDECIRNNTATRCTIKNCVVWEAAASGTDQDGIYARAFSATDQGVNDSTDIINCKIYGANRGGINTQTSSASAVTHLNILSCTVWNCSAVGGFGGGVDAGGIVASTQTSDNTTYVNVFNSISVSNTAGGFAAADFRQNDSRAIWSISSCISSDASITNVIDNGSNNQENTPARTATAGGAEVLFENLTEATADLRLIDDATNNDGQQFQSLDDAHGMSIGGVPQTLHEPTDILGNTRAAVSSNWDCGAHAISNEVSEETPPAAASISSFHASFSVTWEGLVNDSVGVEYTCPVGYRPFSVQFTGTYGSGSLQVQGSNETTPTNWAALASGTALGALIPSGQALFFRPAVVGGSGTTVNVTAYFERDRDL